MSHTVENLREFQGGGRRMCIGSVMHLQASCPPPRPATHVLHLGHSGEVHRHGHGCYLSHQEGGGAGRGGGVEGARSTHSL